MRGAVSDIMRNVLVVDDNEENCYILQKLLESNGLTVQVAKQGREALEMAQAALPDLIISDILMPVMDGYALCKACKSDEKLKNIPFIFYTATYTDPSDEAFALKLGADLFMIKPQEPLVLMEMIQKYLNEDGGGRAMKQPLGSEMEFFRKHNEILFNKLEKKMVELEEANQRLNREVDERKRTEEKLLKLTRVLEESPVAIIVTDINGNIEYANPKFSQISGYSYEEIEDRNLNILRSWDMSTDVYKEFWRTITSNNVWRGDLCSKRKDGNLFWTYLMTSSIKNSQGQITGYMAIMEDISERRKLEAQLIQVQKLEGIGQLAGGVAHDFNNILTGIIGYAYLVYLNMQPDDPLKGYIKHIINYSEKATSITKSLLTFSRKQDTHLSNLNLNDLVSDFHKFLLRLVPENIDIRIQYSDRTLPVLVDQVQIEQVIMNLATNARDAMPDGGKFVITTGWVELADDFFKTHGYGKAGSYAEIHVADTGQGMDQQTREKIFEPFFTTKGLGKGTGLGMAIVYGIVKKHNGFITVQSEIGKGTTFRILLPIVVAVVKEEAAADSEIKPFKGGKETILIAEDEPGIRDLLTTILEEHGYAVIAAADGEEAVCRFHENMDKIDLVMLDGVMPKKGGKEACREIGSLKPEMKFVYMSGYTANIDEFQEIRNYEVHFLQKPALPYDILKKVRDVLDGVNGKT